ncbi:ras-domain-containing protein [Neoconidiobolus thromboides FSU 785]|nr:ras-domain-containing protein [Neoconidiobolus thromboides FSU 785]
MSDTELNLTFKLLLIGNSGVGKSSILLRFIDDYFLPSDEISATIGVDFKVKDLNLDDKQYKLTIWDTAGQERFRTLTSSYYRGAQGVILVYDVTKKETFDNLEQWFIELETYCKNKEVVKMIIGNKVDKESNRAISLEQGEEYAKSKNSLFIECSAKTKLGVQQAVEELVRKIIDTPSLYQKKKENNLKLNQNNNESIETNNSCGC